MLVIKQLAVAVDFHIIIFFHTMEVNGYHQQETGDYILTDNCFCFSFDASVEHLKLGVMFKMLLPHNEWNKCMNPW